jgi:hypothetical protein
MTRCRRICTRVLGMCLMLGLAAAETSYAIEPPPGSRNFTPPGFVPNYFSNEAAPFHGGAGARLVQPGADQFNAAPASGGRAAAASRRHGPQGYAADRAKQRGKLARGKRSYSKAGVSRSKAGVSRSKAGVSRSKAGVSRQAVRAGTRRAGKPVAVRQAARPAVGKAVAVRSRPATAQVASHSRPAARSER